MVDRADHWAVPIILQRGDGSYPEPCTSSRARLTVLSEGISPDEISAELNLAPDRWWLRGEFGSHPTEGRRRRPNPFNGWELASRLPESAPPEAHLLDLVERIGSAAPRVARLVANPAVHSVIVRLGHHTDNWNPGIELSDSLMRKLIALGTGVFFDIYAVEDDESRENWRKAFSRWNDELMRRKAGSEEAPNSETNPAGTDPPDKAVH